MSGDSVGKVAFEDWMDREWPLWRCIQDGLHVAALRRLHTHLDRQHREEVARHEAFASQAVLDMRRKDGLIEAAEAALGEAQQRIRELERVEAAVKGAGRFQASDGSWTFIVPEAALNRGGG